MKKLIKNICFVNIVLCLSCSQIPENNDSIIGIWHSNIAVEQFTEKNKGNYKEWIFNDAYLGRFHHITNNEIKVQTDFSWTYEDEWYTIKYPGTDFLDDVVKISTIDDKIVLKDSEGRIIAVQE